MADRFPLILNTSTNQIQEIASGDQLDLTGNNIANAGIITATTFSGNLTGNVTGNINGNLTGTLQTAAQPNITSLGTLSSLNVSGNASIGGVLTYEDVTNVDSVGIITARDDIKITTDNKSIIMGAGADLSMKHDGTNSYILNNTGSFIISADTVLFNNRANNESKAKLINNGAVELYFDNVKRIETTSAGANIVGNLDVINGHVYFRDNYKVNIGSSSDLQLYHDGSHSFIKDTTTGHLRLENDNIRMRNGAGDELMLTATVNDSVALYHDGNKKFETRSDGIRVHGTELFLGANGEDLRVHHNTQNSYIDSRVGNLYLRMTSFGEPAISCIKDGSVEIYHNAIKKLETTSGGVTITGDLSFSGASARAIRLGDNERIYLGDDEDAYIGSNGGNAEVVGSFFYYNHQLYYDNVRIRMGNSQDLEFYHVAGGDSFIKNNTGSLKIQGPGSNGLDVHIQARPDEEGIKLLNNTGESKVELYYNNEKKFETIGSGIIVYGSEGGGGLVNIYADEGDDNADKWRLHANPNGNFYLQNYTSGAWEDSISATGNGNVELFHDNQKKLETTSSGVTVTGAIVSSQYGSLGNASGVFGRIRVGADVYGNTIKVVLDQNMNLTAHNSIAFNLGAATNGSDAGSSVCVVVSDAFRPTSNNTKDLGSTSYRWRNIYTNDLNLSNEGKSNDVDGTWGNYTIQEGESDLFLINKRNGKKYKFNLTEVS